MTTFTVDGLTGLKKGVHEMFMKNEIKNGEGAYELTKKDKDTGYTFGPVQWDLSKDHLIKDDPTSANRIMARAVFKDILTNAKDITGNGIISTQEVENIFDKVQKLSSSLSTDQIALVNKALQSPYGMEKTKNAYLSELDDKIAMVDDLVKELRASGSNATADYIANNDLMKMLLIDYNNQFSLNGINRYGEIKSTDDGTLVKYLKTGSAVLPNGKKVEVSNNFDILDFSKYVFNTTYAYNFAKKGASDLQRRITNTTNIAGENNILSCLTEGERKRLNEFSSFKTIATTMDQVLKEIQDFFTDASAEAAPIDPLILDLDGDGIESRHVLEGAYFDHNGDGFAEQTGWASSDDGLLVLDRNGNGVIDDGKELFGDQTILRNGTKAANGFQALADLDDNGDGQINTNDLAFAQLRVWRDLDGDGFSAGDELFSLDELTINSINTSYTTTNITDANGNTLVGTGAFQKSNGTSGSVGSYNLQRDLTYSIAKEWLDVPDELASLPDLQGYGNVYDLQQAMVRDAGGQLKSLVEQFMAETNPDLRNNLMEQILFQWTGSEGVNPTSRGIYIDGRKVAALEKLYGQAFVGVNGANPNANAAALLNQSYQSMFEMFTSQLLAQTHLKDIYSKIQYTWDDITQNAKGDLSAVIIDFQNILSTDPVAGKQMLGEFVRTVRGFQAEDMLNYQGFRDAFGSQGEEITWIIDSAGLNSIKGTINNDSLSGSEGNDAITGNQGNDTLYGKNGNDALSGGLGDDTLYGGYLSTTEGVNGAGANDKLYGNEGNDYLYGKEGDDLLYGGDGNDQLYGGYGNDIMEGGAGNDYLSGDGGNDIYRFRPGSGADTISNSGTDSAEIDTVEFGTGITTGSIEEIREGYNLKVKVGSTDSLLLQSWFLNISPYGNIYRVEQLKFADGTVLTADQFEALGCKVFGGTGSETLDASRGNDTIQGYEGNDTLYGRDGNDVLYGGTGDDKLYGGYVSGVEGLAGTGSNDTLYGNEGSDQLYGNEGDDLLYGGTEIDQLYGGYGNDYLEGGAGNDYMSGDGGNDIYMFGLGSGTDTISNSGTDSAEIDTVEFGAGITTGNIEEIREGYSLRVKVGSTGSLLLQNWFLNISPYGNIYRVEQLKFADGTVLTADQFEALGCKIFGGSGSDILDAARGNDTLQGYEGNDTLYGRDGNDVLYGGTGDDKLYGGYVYGAEGLTGMGANDTLYGNEGSDQLYGNEGDDLLFGGTEIDQIYGGSGNDYLEGGAGNDNLYGESGSDILDGGIGDDYLSGSGGNDVYRFGPGSGADTIYNYGTDRAEIDTVEFGAGITINSLEEIREGSSLRVKAGGTDSVLLQSWFLTDYNYGDVYKVEQFKFADGTVLTAGQLEALGCKVFGGTGSEILDASRGNDIVQGYEGNDTLYGRDGNDLLYGGTGDDKLYGGYVSGAEGLAGTGTNDTLYGNEGSDQLYGNEGDDLIYGGTENDQIYGGYGNDYLEGGEANDTLYGESGNDTLDGGAGNDFLSGGGGNDIYRFEPGSGLDALYNYDPYNTETETLEFGVNPLDLILTRSGNDLSISMNGQTDQITIQNWYYGASYQIDVLKSSEGIRLLNTQVDQLIQAMATFCTNNGMSWSQAIQNKPQDVQQLLAQYWTPQQ